MRLAVIRNKVSNLQLYRLCIFPPISPLCTVLDEIRWFYTTFKIFKMKENRSRINPLYSLSDRSTRGVSLQVDIQSGSNLFLPLPQIVFVVIGLTTVVWSGILKNDLLGIWAEVVISVNREKNHKIWPVSNKNTRSFNKMVISECTNRPSPPYVLLLSVPDIRSVWFITSKSIKFAFITFS